ncbi:MAG TPA: hypothetical protein VFR35_06280 [Actinoplanes sp.]|nr:hypothetical protein [Actinoplanes sp.]
MNDLLALAIQGHGGSRRWQQFSRFHAGISITGALWVLKGRPGLLEGIVVDGETRDQRVIVSPFPVPGWYTTWEPYRQTIETSSGVPTAERRDPAASFSGLTRRSPWDDFQMAYFAGEASWNYLTAPFVLARSDFVTEEIEPWHEDGQVWRRLLVTYPDSVVAHCRQQMYHFDDAGLLRRLDYTIDILGGGPAVHYPSAYREFTGIMVPTRRKDYVANPDGTPARESVSIAIDVTDVIFS